MTRVSTQRQQRSGLGIEAQRATIARFAEAEGLTIIAEVRRGRDRQGRRRARSPAAACCFDAGYEQLGMRTHVLFSVGHNIPYARYVRTPMRQSTDERR